MSVNRSEKAGLNDTLMSVSALPDTLIWRNNTGQAWQGQRLKLTPGRTVVVEPGMVILRAARPVTFGLTGSADVIGAIQGRPVAIEQKTSDGRQSDDQERFERHWKKAGGLYILARNGEDAVVALMAAL